jgi:hypothetical protein
MSKEAIIALLDEIREESTEVGNRTEKRSIAPPDLSVLYIKLADAIEAMANEAGAFKNYVELNAVLNQSGADGPDVVILSSDMPNMDDLDIGYQATGRYYIYKENSFPFRRTHVILGNSSGSQIASESITKNCPKQFVIRTENSSGTLGNGRLIDTALTIKVFDLPFTASSDWVESTYSSVDTDMDGNQFTDIKFPIADFTAVMDEKKLRGGQKVEIEGIGIYPLKYSYFLVADEAVHVAIDELVSDLPGTINVRFLAEGFY